MTDTAATERRELEMLCSFCGGTDIDTKFDELRFLKPYCWVVVCRCGASGPNRDSEHAARAAWNTRVNSHAALEAERDALAKSLRGAKEALRSYEYGNSSPELAEHVADKIDERLAALGESR